MAAVAPQAKSAPGRGYIYKTTANAATCALSATSEVWLSEKITRCTCYPCGQFSGAFIAIGARDCRS
jgi:hypothetical protein